MRQRSGSTKDIKRGSDRDEGEVATLTSTSSAPMDHVQRERHLRQEGRKNALGVGHGKERDM